MCWTSEVCVSFSTWNNFSYFYLPVSFRGLNQLSHTSLMSSFITSLNVLFGLCLRAPSCQLPPQHLSTPIFALPPLDMSKQSHSGFGALSPNQLTWAVHHFLILHITFAYPSSSLSQRNSTVRAVYELIGMILWPAGTICIYLGLLPSEGGH